MDALATVRQQLARLRVADHDLRIFGATFHRYRLNRCLPERAILTLQKNLASLALSPQNVASLNR